jgi:hypothetical protein
MLTKEQVLESIKNMPEEKFEDIDVLLERLQILNKIHTGLDQLNSGQKISLEQLEKSFEEWDN